MTENAKLSPALVKVIQRHRVARELTMYQLAKLSGLDKSTLGKLESGERLPTVETVKRLADALEIPLWKLVKEAEALG